LRFESNCKRQCPPALRLCPPGPLYLEGNLRGFHGRELHVLTEVGDLLYRGGLHRSSPQPSRGYDDIHRKKKEV